MIATMLSTSRSWSSPSSGLSTGGCGWSGSNRTSRSRDGGGEPVEDVEDEVAVRVDDDGAAAGVDVLDDHVGSRVVFPTPVAPSMCR